MCLCFTSLVRPTAAVHVWAARALSPTMRPGWIPHPALLAALPQLCTLLLPGACRPICSVCLLSQAWVTCLLDSELQAYPEFCRQVFDAAPEGFQVAVAELQNKYGKVSRLWLRCLLRGCLSEPEPELRSGRRNGRRDTPHRFVELLTGYGKVSRLWRCSSCAACWGVVSLSQSCRSSMAR